MVGDVKYHTCDGEGILQSSLRREVFRLDLGGVFWQR